MLETIEGRFPGHLRAEAPYRTEALQLLLSHYDSYQPFVDDCLKLKAGLPSPVFGNHPENYFRLRIALSTFADRWGLSCIPEMREAFHFHVRRAIEQTGEQYGSIVGTPFRPLSFVAMYWEPEDPEVRLDERRWAWRLGAFETLAELRDRIADDLDVVPSTLPCELTQQLWNLPAAATSLGWKLTDLPHKLPLHVRWLFLRLCPQPDRPLGVTAIANGEFDPNTVRRAINSLATDMKIELPVLPVGRPRKRRGAAA